MSLALERLLLESSKYLLKHGSLNNHNCQRGVRGVQRVIRTKLPQYKKNLHELPILTKLLVSEESSQLDAIKLRKTKLDVYKQYLPTNTSTNLIEALLHKDNDIDRLLKIIDLNLDTMTSFYLGVSFEALDDMMRINSCDKATVSVSPEFMRLCTRTLYKLRYFESDEILKLVKCLSTLDVPDDTLIMQATLKMSEHLINDFNQEELQCLERSSKFRALFSTRSVQCNK